jgi:hypothetical protein
MACPVVVDLRNIYRPDDMKKHGFAYTCVGRSPTHQPVNLFAAPTRVEQVPRTLSDAIGK